ncbi:AbrB/MazE/SpoVT family DNA-binding domain-containing protein [Amycolatopsis sp.]|uniref:AbrB/MazE/SpoVT family DNA-binding domain-containing protein n=1 Tax=Amycolatopsis sp. TaxID=37632 RepID=UPI00261449F4|nr:AbrB/MazE/SpoVT family DNA-binding domain-containing protein [Amycolatopsis sp.]
MTGSVIKPVVIPATPLQRDGHATGLPATLRTLPLPSVPTPRTNTAVYGLAAVDRRGRIADHAIVHALGWQPGTRLDIRETHGLLLIHADPRGVFSVTKQGHLRLPAPVRHRCCLVPGDRVLLAADPDRGLLIVHPPAALDDILAQRHAGLLGGDSA